MEIFYLICHGQSLLIFVMQDHSKIACDLPQLDDCGEHIDMLELYKKCWENSLINHRVSLHIIGYFDLKKMYYLNIIFILTSGISIN